MLHTTMDTSQRREQEIKEFVIKTGRQALAVLTIWLVGWFGFSYAWILGSLFVFLWWRRDRKAKKAKLNALRAITCDEKNVLQQLKNLPSWVCFPDVERAEWLNQIVKQMWPFISTMVRDILKNKVEPEIQKKLPSIINSFTFEEVDFGNRPLKIGGIRVYTEHVRPNEIVMDAEIIYAGDADIKVAVHGVSAGISDVQLRGTVRIELNPLLSKPPLIGAIRFYFLETPEFNFDFTNLLNVLDIPGLSDIVKKILQEVIESFVVLPNRVTIPIGNAEDLESLKYPLPLGALEIQILEAIDLVAHDKNLFKKDSSDPYVICKIGSFNFQTECAEKTLKPKWKNAKCMTFIDTLVGREMCLEVFDKDTLRDDSLGHAEILMPKLTHSSSEDMWLPLKDTKSGSLHIGTGWFEFSDDASKIKENTRSALFIKLENAKDLPAVNMDEDTSSTFVEISVGNQKASSKTQRNTRNPVWEELHSFFLTNASHETINFKIRDADAEEPLGVVDFQISKLLESPKMTINQKFQLTKCFTNADLCMTLELKALVPPPANDK